MRKAANILFIAFIIIYTCMLSFALSSCKTVNIPGETILKDSVVYKDTTVYITVPPIVVPGDSVTLHDTVPCPDTQWNGIAKSESGRSQIKAEIKNEHIRIFCKTDSLCQEINNLRAVIKAKESYSKSVITIPVDVVKWEIPWWVWLWTVINIVITVVIFKRFL